MMVPTYQIKLGFVQQIWRHTQTSYSSLQKKEWVGSHVLTLEGLAADILSLNNNLGFSVNVGIYFIEKRPWQGHWELLQSLSKWHYERILVLLDLLLYGTSYEILCVKGQSKMLPKHPNNFICSPTLHLDQ